jgi:uncharacterized protein (DUF433 family)
MVSMTILAIETIVSDPDIRNGDPVIAGTSVRVVDIVAYHLYNDKMDVERLAKNFGVSVGDVYAALTYYHQHQAEIDQWFEDDEREAEQLLSEIEKARHHHDDQA